MPLRDLPDADHFPALDPAYDPRGVLAGVGADEPPVKVLLLYGSLRQRSYSRFAVEEAARLLRAMGAEVRIFDPAVLPFPDQDGADGQPAVAELRELVIWADAMVWSSPETHGNLSGLMKAQLDHIPLDMGPIRPTQGCCLALIQVAGGTQSFNALNNMRLLGRWLRMFVIPNQLSIGRASGEFDEAGRMRASALYDRLVDVAEELMRVAVLMRAHREVLGRRYSERARP